MKTWKLSPNVSLKLFASQQQANKWRSQTKSKAWRVCLNALSSCHNRKSGIVMVFIATYVTPKLVAHECLHTALWLTKPDLRSSRAEETAADVTGILAEQVLDKLKPWLRETPRTALEIEG